MSTEDRNTPEQKYAMTPPGQRHQADDSHPAAMALMKRLGGKGGYTPMPPDQHRWQARKGEAPIHRIWSWMCSHCLAWGHRSDYAVDKHGNELHLEHIAADLDMDLPNVYRYWKDGTERGLWRDGTKKEGERRLFFSGRVPEPKGEETENQNVCTDNLPSGILKQIKDWPQERVARFATAWKGITTLDRELHSALIAARRHMIEREQDSVLTQFGVKPNRQEHQKAGETPEQAAARRRRFEPLLAPLQLYVQTIRESVQSQNGTPYNGQEESVQTSPTLLLLASLNGGEERACVRDSALPVSRPVETPSLDGERALKSLPVPETPKVDRAADRTALHEAIPRWQDLAPNTRFSQQRFALGKADRILTEQILDKLAGVPAFEFVRYLDHRFDDRAPGKEGLGILLNWAGDFLVWWDAQAELRRRADAAERKYSQKAEENRYALAKQMLADPEVLEEDKALARTVLGLEAQGAAV